MAKEIILSGDGQPLKQLSDPWGGENKSGASLERYGQVVPAGYKWGMDFAEVERFIKAMFSSLDERTSSKVGHIARVTLTINNIDKECLVAFSSEDDFQVWNIDHNDSSHQPLALFELPSGGTGGVIERYRAELEKVPAPIPLVVLEPHLAVTLRFTSMIYSGGQYIDLGENGTVTFYRSTDGGENWSVTGTATIRSGVDASYDVGGYLVKDRETMIRAKASFSYNGNTVESVYVILATATYTELSVKNKTDYTYPLYAENGYITLAFAVLGSAAKTLHVEVGASDTYDIGTHVWSATELIGRDTEYPDTAPLSITVSAPNALTHGVHTVKAWLSCDDGTGNELSSEVVINRFMVVNPSTEGADLTAPRLMLKEVVGRVANYEDSKLASFAVWNPDPSDPSRPSQAPLQLVIRLTDNTGNVEYYHNEPTVYNNISYPIQTTVEIEGDSPLYYTRLSIYQGELNFMQESTGRLHIVVEVDNSESYTVVPGADFVLNPKNRDNGESNPRTIINQRTGQEVGGSTFEGFNGVTDLWVTAQDGQKVLRVLAGSRVTINYEPFESFIADGSSRLTLELDFAVRNITREDEPMIDVSQQDGGELLGLRLLPLDGMIKCAGYQIDETQNFGWQEGVRTRLTLVLDPSVTVKADNELTWQRTWNDKESRPLSLAKVYINAVPCRELVYADNQAETAQGRLPGAGTWCRGTGHGGIKIGNPHADIDIYSIRCYRSALSADNVLRNYIASLPDASSKLLLRERNAITRNGRISYEDAKSKYRCLTLVGQDQYKGNQDKKTGYPCYWRIDHNDPSLSGTIGKAAYQAHLNGTLGDKKCLMVTAQGTTANTYWDNNEQTKIDGITYKVTIPFLKVHADFGWEAEMSTGDGCECPMYLNSARIEGTSWASLPDAQKALVTIEVPDGWFDGNGWSEHVEEMGMYHGQFYTSAGGAKCSKVVNKINYASSMQSHKMGATRFFHDVMTAVTGGNSVTAGGARFAVREECFMLFTEHPDDHGKVEFRGMCTFGDGKFDKAVFGLKSSSGTFAFEGLQNNLPLCDFRVPADDAVTYDPDKESWMYAGVKSFEYGLGKTKTVDGKKYPTDVAEAAFRRFVNFVYCHNTSLRYYEGSLNLFNIAWNALDESTRNEMVHYQYWCTDDLKLYRYDFTTQQWVGAGTWNQDSLTYTAGDRNLSQDPMTGAAYQQWREGQHNGDYGKLNEAFINAIANHGRQHFGSVADVENFKTHYNVVNFLLAGTDNCSKNMYYQYDPETGVIYLDGDDLDSILPTDNNGNNTKVYFLDRIHDVEDYVNGHKPQIDYEGRASALFNFIEAAYEKNSNELRENMGRILSAMITLCGGNAASLMGCIEKYFFSIQTYFPEVAWCEQARLRYEWPKSFGYISTGEQARSIDPITQQVGNQLEGELQYMRRRIALIASYAAWGQFAAAAGETGLSDAGSSLSMVPGSGYSGNNYRFSLVAHQWIYPVGKMGNGLINPHIRAVPGVETVFVNGSQSPIGGDQSAVLAASNYYRKLGNLGAMVVGNSDFQVEANRLTDFVAEPGAGDTSFRPMKLSLTTPNLRSLSLRGCASLGGSMSLSSLTRLESIDLLGTSYTSVELPATDKLTALTLPAALTSLVIDGQPNVANTAVDEGAVFSMEGYGALTSITVKGNAHIDTYGLLSGAKTANAQLAVVDIDDIAWTGVSPAFIEWLLAVPSCVLRGTIAISGTVDFSLARRIYDKWHGLLGNGLTITYAMTGLSGLQVGGERYIGEAGSYPYDFIATGNDINSVAWSLEWAESTGYRLEDYAEIDAETGVLTVKQIFAADAESKPKVRVTLAVNGTLVVTYEVGLYYRDAAVGDYVFADGSWSDLDNPLKTVVAGCCYVGDEFEDSDGITKRVRLAVAKKDIINVCWGLYNGDFPSVVCTIGQGHDGTNFTQAFKRLLDTAVEQYSSPYSQTEVSFKTVGENDIIFTQFGNDAGWAKARLVDVYGFGKRVNNGYVFPRITYGKYYTLLLVLVRDRLLLDNSTQFPYQLRGANGVTYMEALNEAMNIASQQGVKYKQYYFPAASVCDAYEPTGLKNGEVLAEHLREGNWFLPTITEIKSWYNNRAAITAKGIDGFVTISSSNYNRKLWSSEECSYGGTTNQFMKIVWMWTNGAADQSYNENSQNGFKSSERSVRPFVQF